MSLIETLKKFDIKVQGGPDENIRFIDALLVRSSTLHWFPGFGLGRHDGQMHVTC